MCVSLSLFATHHRELTLPPDASNGARVFIVGRRVEALEDTEKLFGEGKGQLKEQGGSIISSVHFSPAFFFAQAHMRLLFASRIQGDVSSKEGIKAIANDVKSKGASKLDVLINNSGIDRSPDINLSSPNDLDQLEGELWEKVEW